MAVTAAHVEGRGGQVEGPVELRLYGPDKSAKIWQVTQVEEEEPVLRHDIMIADFQKAIAGVAL